ncbi:UNVERIFIED_CONTAM: hypothetical protein K2H54_005685 [Gekko kuhli]
MAPKKGQGPSKGKQAAPKKPAHKPPKWATLLDSSDKDKQDPVNAVILERLAALESRRVSQLMPFCVSLRGKGLPVHSIGGKLSSLAYASKASGFEEKMGDFRMPEGWSREGGKVIDTRQPLTPTVLMGLQAQMDTRLHCSMQHHWLPFGGAAD